MYDVQTHWGWLEAGNHVCDPSLWLAQARERHENSNTDLESINCPVRALLAVKGKAVTLWVVTLKSFHGLPEKPGGRKEHKLSPRMTQERPEWMDGGKGRRRQGRRKSDRFMTPWEKRSFISTLLVHRLMSRRGQEHRGHETDKKRQRQNGEQVSQKKKNWTLI